MSENDDLKARIESLERFTLKHFSHLYARVEPGEIPDTIEGMKAIYVNPTSPKEPKKKPPAPQADSAAGNMEGIYTHFTSPKAK